MLKQILKSIISIFICMVIFLSLNCFAIIVSDNDSSAFVTKTEFDTLKNDMSERIKNYESSIETKIDGSIAAYLANMELKKTENKSLIVKDWEEYTMLNGVISNEYKYPDFQANSTWLSNSVNTNFRKVWFAFATLEYKGSHTSNRRVLVENVTPALTLDLSDVTWAGVALNANESWSCSKIFRNDALSPYGGSGTRYIYLLQCMNLEVNGYYENINNDDSLWNPKWQYTLNNSWSSEFYYYSYPLKAYSYAANISYESNGTKTFDYLHVGNWNASTAWECNIKDCNTYFKTSPNNTLRTPGWFQATTKSGTWSADDAARYSGGGETWTGNSAVSFTNDNLAQPPVTNNHTIPTIGLIGDTIVASNIYQFKNLIDDDGNAVTRLTMVNGVPLMKVKKDEEVEWEVTFSKSTVDGMSVSPEVKVALAYKPFTNYANTNETGTQDNDDYVKIEGFEKGSFPATTNKKVKIRFKSEKDGYIYLKFFPSLASESDLSNKFWEVKLDVENSNTYTSTTE